MTRDDLKKRMARYETELQAFLLEANKQAAFLRGRIQELQELLDGSEPGRLPAEEMARIKQHMH